MDSIYCFDAASVTEECKFGFVNDVLSPITESLGLVNVNFTSDALLPGNDACVFKITPTAPSNVFITVFGPDTNMACVNEKPSNYELTEIHKSGNFPFMEVETISCVFLVKSTQDQP